MSRATGEEARRIRKGSGSELAATNRVGDPEKRGTKLSRTYVAFLRYALLNAGHSGKCYLTSLPWDHPETLSVIISILQKQIQTGYLPESHR